MRPKCNLTEEEVWAIAEAMEPTYHGGGPVLERQFCACGQEVRQTTPTGVPVRQPRDCVQCGDCRMMTRRYLNPRHIDHIRGGRTVATAKPIDARIRDAREGRNEDPTTWTAGAPPGWEWP